MKKTFRSVVKLGASLYITLPVRWVREKDLKKGDYLEVVPDGQDLRVKVVKKDE